MYVAATLLTTDRITPRRPCSLAYTLAWAASDSRRSRPNRSSCQLAPTAAWYWVPYGSAPAGSRNSLERDLPAPTP
jgi:hypothetical protein